MLGIVIKQLFARLQISQPCPSVSERLFWRSLKLFPFLQAWAFVGHQLSPFPSCELSGHVAGPSETNSRLNGGSGLSLQGSSSVLKTFLL